MNTEALKLNCPKCGEEFTNAEKIKIIHEIESFRNLEKCKEDIKTAEGDIQKLTDEIKDLDNKTNEYAAKIDELNDNNSEDAENQKNSYKESIINAQLNRLEKEKELANCKQNIEKLNEEIAKINKRFDIFEFFKANTVLSEYNDYADLQEIIKNNDDTIRFCAKHGFLDKKYIDENTIYESFLSQYHLSAMFSLVKDDSNIILYEFKKEKSDKIKMGIKYGDEEINVLTEIENWLNDISMPEDKKNYKLLSVPAEQINYKYLYPYKYTPKFSSVKEYLKQKNTLQLSEIADIIVPESNYKKKGNILKTDEYYFGISGAIDSLKNKINKPKLKCKNDYISDCLLQKDDIVLTKRNDFIFVDEQPKKEIYADSYEQIVLRAKENISARYLFNYLNSNIGNFLINRISEDFYNIEKHKEFVNKLSIIPVILPEEDETEFDCSEFNATVNKFEKE